MYLYGAGGHAKVVIDALLSQGLKPLGIFEDPGNIGFFRGVRVYPGIRSSGSFPKLKAPLIICIGDNRYRAEFAKLLDAEFGIAIQKEAIVASDVVVGKGTVILHGAIVQSAVTIGEHVVVNTSASIDHDCQVGNYVHICPCATLCGRIQVGEGSLVGAGATILPGIRIGKWCVIGAGAVVIRDVPDFTTVVGNPARMIP